MASSGHGNGSLVNFYLTQEQQDLLFTALNANKQQPSPSASHPGLPPSSSSFRSAPLQSIDHAGFQENPYLDGYDYDFGDSSLDFSFAAESAQAKGSGDFAIDTAASSKSDSTENDSPEKRSHPDDEEDDTSPGNDSKRHEAGDKVPKKPGRKPLTSEPTSKRKAQNRAAQRAFRERKEKHLKDLETKVEELEKASEAANHENSMLRAQVERMTTELSHYKQQMTLIAHKPVSHGNPQPFNQAAVNNIHDVNFQFEFPKFGSLPTPPMSKPQKSPSQSISPPSNSSPSPAASQGNERRAPTNVASKYKEGANNFSSAYTPSMGTSATAGSKNGSEMANASHNGFTSSPSASSHSNLGPSSSCGTSPEAFTQSPTGHQALDTLTTIGEEHPSMSSIEYPFAQFANNYLGGNYNLDWFVQQNGGQFDPQLFGDYREPQDNVLATTSFDDLFAEPLETDFTMPYNVAPSPGVTKKTNLIDDIEAQQHAIEEDTIEPGAMSCNQLWNKLQTCPKAQSGEFDLDGLCSELTKKAKCSGHGPVVAEHDFDTILQKYMGKDVPSAKMADKMGIKVEKGEVSAAPVGL